MANVASPRRRGPRIINYMPRAPRNLDPACDGLGESVQLHSNCLRGKTGNKTVFFKAKSPHLNETWGLRRKEEGLLPAGIWSVGRAAAGCSLTARVHQLLGGYERGHLRVYMQGMQGGGKISIS